MTINSIERSKLFLLLSDRLTHPFNSLLQHVGAIINQLLVFGGPAISLGLRPQLFLLIQLLLHLLLHPNILIHSPLLLLDLLAENRDHGLFAFELPGDLLLKFFSFNFDLTVTFLLGKLCNLLNKLLFDLSYFVARMELGNDVVGF